MITLGNDDNSKKKKILGVIGTKEWAAAKRNILSELMYHRAIDGPDYKMIFVKNDEDYGISMLLDAILRGSEDDYSIFKIVVKDILEIDIDKGEYFNCFVIWRSNLAISKSVI